MLILLTTFVSVLSGIIFTCIELSFASIEIAGTSETTVKFERLSNSFGRFLVYYDQEVVSGNCTSYSVSTMMSCRRIMNASQPTSSQPPNVVSVGKLQNGDISCNVCFQNVSDLQLGPKLGFFTFYSWQHSLLSPASNGIFYTQFVTDNQKAQIAASFCNDGNGWNVAWTITAGQKNILRKFISVYNLDLVHVQANCSTGHWNDQKKSPFTDVTLQPTHSYVQLKSDGQYQCICPGDSAKVVCMKNIFSIPWNEI